jgi:hypothetical protein
VSLAALGPTLQQNVKLSPLSAKTLVTLKCFAQRLSVSMNNEREDEHFLIFQFFPVYYFIFYHECPDFDRPVQFCPVFFKKVFLKGTIYKK